MTVKEMRKATEVRQVVYFRGGEYYIVGFVSRYGRESYMTSKVPEDDWWYQIILKDFHSAAKIEVLADINEISIKRLEL